MDCGVAAVQNSQSHMTGWDVSLYKLGIEIKMEAHIHEEDVRVDDDSPGISGSAD
jgi:hypothetical protein